MPPAIHRCFCSPFPGFSGGSQLRPIPWILTLTLSASPALSQETTDARETTEVQETTDARETTEVQETTDARETTEVQETTDTQTTDTQTTDTQTTKTPPHQKSTGDDASIKEDAHKDATAERTTPAPQPTESPATEGAAAEGPTAEGAATEGAAAEGPTAEAPLEISTSTFSRFELRRGYERLGVSRGRTIEGDTTVYRLRLGLRTRPVDLGNGLSALVQVTPQASGQYGMVSTIGEQSLGLFEGYLRVQTDATALELGRFQLDYGDALILGNLDWNQAGRAFQGARLRHRFRSSWVDAFITQTPRASESIAEGHPRFHRPLFAGDTYLWGVYAGLGELVSTDMALDLYVLGLSSAKTRQVPVDPDDASAGTFTRHSATEVTFGTRLKDTFAEFFDYRVEAGLQLGQRWNPVDQGRTVRSVFAYQVDGELGVAPVQPIRAALGAAYASGDDPDTERNEAWNELYPTGHRWLGLMDIAGARTNIASLNAKLRAQVFDATTVFVDLHYFSRVHAPEARQRALGSEIDAYVVQKFGKALSARALYGAFLPNEGHYGTAALAQYVEAELHLRF